MTTWTDILNGQVDAGSPLNASLMTALRDNNDALIEGDSTLPQFPAGGLLLLDSQELAGSAATVQFDPVELSTFNVLIITGVFEANGSLNEVQVRESAGTWRDVGAFDAGASGTGTAFDVRIFNANNHGAFTRGNGNIVWSVSNAYSLGSPLNRTDDSRNASATTGTTGVGYHTYAEAVDEIRISCTGGTFLADSVFNLYGVKSGTIEGTAS